MKDKQLRVRLCDEARQALNSLTTDKPANQLINELLLQAQCSLKENTSELQYDTQ